MYRPNPLSAPGGCTHRLLPFAQGGLRRCFHMWDESEGDLHLVGKESLFVEAYAARLGFHKDSFRCHAVATRMARAFNTALGKVRVVSRGFEGRGSGEEGISGSDPRTMVAPTG